MLLIACLAFATDDCLTISTRTAIFSSLLVSVREVSHSDCCWHDLVLDIFRPNCYCLAEIVCIACRSEVRKLDVGLHVSAVKVSQRQPMEPSQASNGHSPYSTKAADSKGVTKRKGVVRSATFSAGSCEQTDTAHLRDNMMGHSVGRGTDPTALLYASCRNLLQTGYQN